MAFAPVGEQHRVAILAIERREHLLGLRHRDVVLVGRDQQQRGADPVGLEERAVAQVAAGIAPGRRAHARLGVLGPAGGPGDAQAVGRIDPPGDLEGAPDAGEVGGPARLDGGGEAVGLGEDRHDAVAAEAVAPEAEPCGIEDARMLRGRGVDDRQHPGRQAHGRLGVGGERQAGRQHGVARPHQGGHAGGEVVVVVVGEAGGPVEALAGVGDHDERRRRRSGPRRRPVEPALDRLAARRAVAHGRPARGSTSAWGALTVSTTVQRPPARRAAARRRAGRRRGRRPGAAQDPPRRPRWTAPAGESRGPVPAARAAPGSIRLRGRAGRARPRPRRAGWRRAAARTAPSGAQPGAGRPGRPARRRRPRSAARRGPARRRARRRPRAEGRPGPCANAAVSATGRPAARTIQSRRPSRRASTAGVSPSQTARGTSGRRVSSASYGPGARACARPSGSTCSSRPSRQGAPSGRANTSRRRPEGDQLRSCPARSSPGRGRSTWPVARSTRPRRSRWPATP